MKEIGLGVESGRLPRPVFHIVGIGNDQFRPFGHQVVSQLGDSDSRPVSRINLVDVNHFRAGYLLLHVLAGFVMGLAPAVIIVRTHQEKAKNVCFFCCQCPQRDAKGHR